MTSRWCGRRISAHHLSTPARFFSAALAIALVATGIATAARLQIPPHGDRSAEFPRRPKGMTKMRNRMNSRTKTMTGREVRQSP